MTIENTPCLRSLNGFVEKLAVEQRAEVYRIARNYYVIGVGDGVLQASLSFTGAGQSKTLTNGTELNAYLEGKIKELETAPKPVGA
ncbi:MAG: hypothetical protein Q7S74_03455 [Nanoarchaeota archaeon]|nr:hypothetical protein [Nanoarchaeota archaeon]